MVSPEFKEKLSNFGLDDAPTINVLKFLQIHTIDDVGCFSAEDFVDAGMKLFKARKLIQIADMASGGGGGTVINGRVRSGGLESRENRNSYYEHRSDSFKKKLLQQQQQRPPSPPRQPFLGRTQSQGNGSQRLSSVEPPRTSIARPNFSSQALLDKRAKSPYHPKSMQSQEEEVKLTGRASISQHPLVKQELEAAERLEQQQLLEEQRERRRQLRRIQSEPSDLPLTPKDTFLQKQQQRQQQYENNRSPGDFHGQEHVVYEYHNYSSLHPNDRPPPITTSNTQQRGRGGNGRSSIMITPNIKQSSRGSVTFQGSSLDGPAYDNIDDNFEDPNEALLDFVGDDRRTTTGRQARGSMESVMSFAQPSQEAYDVHEADYCFEEATKLFASQLV
jgi:hypothetical protein